MLVNFPLKKNLFQSNKVAEVGGGHTSLPLSGLSTPLSRSETSCLPLALSQPRPQGAFPWLWGPKAREKRPGDEVGAVSKMNINP